MKEFKRQGMTPVPGMKITSEGSTGKILTVNGGRVKVDFNHELAGKDLIFDVDVTEIIDNDEDKIKSMIELHYAAPNMDINKTVIDIDGDVVNITLDDVGKTWTLKKSTLLIPSRKNKKKMKKKQKNNSSSKYFFHGQ